jgi:hypothetical protein
MDRQAEKVDVYSILKPVFFVSKVLGLSPYNAVGDIGNRSTIVTVPAIIYSIGLFILNIGVLVYSVLTAMFIWENICTSGESIILLETLCLALCAYCTCLLGCRQTARQITRLNDLIGKTCYSAWRRDLQLLLAMQVLFVIMIITCGVLDTSQVTSELHDFHSVLFTMIYYVTDLAGFMSEHQFVAFMHILKRTVQIWNKYTDGVCENDDVINSPLYGNEMKRRKSVIFIETNNSVTPKCEKIHSKLMHFKQLRELHASACDIAESVNAVYSPMLLLSVARSFTTLTHILYYILYSFIVQKTIFFCKLKENECYFLWLIYSSVRLIWLVYFTALTAKEVSYVYILYLSPFHSAF